MARISKAEQNAIARELVNDLHVNGMSYSEIGKRLGRDPSLISQIAHGKPKGASFVDALRQIGAGEESIGVARRTTKAGIAAKVRKGVEIIPGTEAISVRTKKGSKTISKGLGQVEGKGQYARWNVKFNSVKTISDRIVKDAWVPGRLPQGWTTDDLLNRINNPQAGDNWKAGDARGALSAIALEQNASKITSHGALAEAHLFTSE